MYRTFCLVIILAVVLVAPCFAVTKAIIDLGSPDSATNMTHIQGGDGDTVTASIGGLSCRRNSNPNDDFYFYFGISDSFAYQGSRPDMYITIHYYDSGTGSLTLNYDAISDVWKSGGYVTLTNTNTWKLKTFHVTDGYFGNRQNGGADFRIAGPVGYTYHLDMVYARDFCGPNPRVRMVPPPGRPAMDGAPFREMMENVSQWPVTRGLTKVLSYYNWAFDNYNDQDLGSWLQQISSWGIGMSLETGVVKEHSPTGVQSFNSTRYTFDRIINLGGDLEGFVMDEPLTAVRGYKLGSDDYAVNQTVDWIQLVRQNYPGVQIGSIEAHPYLNRTTLEWWIRTLQDRCAQRGVEGIDYFVLDADWRSFNTSAWQNVKTLENYCRNNGMPFSVIYWNSPHSTSLNNADYYNDIMNQGNAYRNVGGSPDEYCVQSWETIPTVQVPENGSYTFTRAAHDFINEFVPRPQTPYNGVISLPGTVQAENFDKGGQNVAYNDLSIGNTGGAYRIDNSVDIESCSEGGCNVGWIETGEWMEYTVSVPSSGNYDIGLRVATPNTGSSFRIEMNGVNATGNVSFGSTGGWQNWSTCTVTNVSLNSGQQVMRVVAVSGGWNLNYISVAYDSTPPSPVTNFTATAGNGQNALSWTNPGSDFAGTRIRFKTTGFPTGPNDGTQIYDSNGTNYTHTGLTNGVTYYYSAYAHDSVPNYATAANASATPVPAYCFRDEFNYSNGALNGNGGWTGNATASHIEIVGGYVRIFGGPGTYYATKTVNCGVDGSGNIWVRCKVNGETGASTMWSLRINDASGANFARWYGCGTTARGRIGETASVTGVQNLSGGWEEIAVKINPAADTSEFFFNGNSVGTLSHSSQGAGSAIGQLRFERIDNNNATSEHLYFDDLRVGG